MIVAASQINWLSVVPDESCVDTQWNLFYSCLVNLVDAHIPKHLVMMSDRDKEWITLRIHERWNAYRSKDRIKYNHLKKKVKIEIALSKLSGLTK